MKHLIILIVFAALVSTSHATALFFAKKQLWKLHQIINGTLWIVVFIGTGAIQFYLPRVEFPFWLRAVGFLSIFIGLALVIRVRLLLGRNQAMGIRFFFPEEAKRVTHSLYTYLNNPMYDGFILLLVGLGFGFGIPYDFYLAGASFILFNVFLAAVENYEWKWNPF